MLPVYRDKIWDFHPTRKGRKETMINEDMSFIALDENGSEKVCEVLFTFDSDETGKSYIVYTDNSVDENGGTRVFASTYDPNAKEQRLMPIETEKEWKIIEIILEELQAGIKGESN